MSSRSKIHKEFFPAETAELTKILEEIEIDLEELEQRVIYFKDLKSLHTSLVGRAYDTFENIQEAKITTDTKYASDIIENTITILQTLRAGVHNLENSLKKLERQNTRARRGSTSSTRSTSTYDNVENVCTLWDKILDALAPYFVSSYTQRCS